VGLRTRARVLRLARFSVLEDVSRLMSSEHQTRVSEFMRRAGQQQLDIPGEPDEKHKLLAARLILEEALETIQRGLGVDVLVADAPLLFDDCVFVTARPFDIVEAIDGCCDVHVVATWTMCACGVDDEVQELVDLANLAKFGSGSYQDPDTGKWRKPPDWRAPEIGIAIAAQAARRMDT
jgi:predicted HAD superfamily Cof-like phosphohydrolase